MKLSEILAQDVVKLEVGNYLASTTEATGYVPTYKDTDAIHTGRYLYQIVGVGEADVDTGEYSKINVVPVKVSEDGKSFVSDTEHPIIIQETGKVVYVTGRNHPNFKDAYNGREHHFVENIAAGQEHRQVLLAFLEFVKSEFSLGVNDFVVTEPEQIVGA